MDRPLEDDLTLSQKIKEFELIVSRALQEYHPNIKFKFIEDLYSQEVSCYVEWEREMHNLCTITYEGLEYTWTKEFKNRIRESIENTEFIKNDKDKP